MTIFREIFLGIAVVALLLSAGDPVSANPAAAPRVDSPAGSIEGVAEGELRIFKGVPFAQPPVAARRWQPPAPLPRWQGVKKATAFGPACFQPSTKLSNIYAGPRMPMSEECLTLNIWAPEKARGAPVFFWIHGGALTSGSSRDPLNDGSRLAQRGIIVVSINYRLGVLGWLAHPGLSAESAEAVSGNYGLLDQIQALRWVRDNIAAFGGDPANVTIAGESAGALSVMYLMASPPARGLFDKAIAQSAYMISTPALKTAVHGALSAEENGAKLGTALKAPDIVALRAIDAERLTTTAPAAGFAPWGAVDGRVLPDQLVTIFDKGEQAPVPILAGFNSGEIRSLTVLAPPVPASTAEYERIIRESHADLADAFLRLYPSAEMKESILATTRDALYGWTAERLVRRQAKLGQPAYLYLWDHGYPSADDAGLHAFHASELPYVFGTFDGTPPLWPKVPETAKERGLSDAIMGYWASFASNAQPRADRAPDWPAYGPGGAYMHFADEARPARDLMPGMYRLIEEVICRRAANGSVAWNWNFGLWSPKLTPKAAGC